MKRKLRTISQFARTVAKEVYEGSEAFASGILKDDNPYPLKSKEYLDWTIGWEERQAHEEYLKDEESKWG